VEREEDADRRDEDVLCGRAVDDVAKKVEAEGPLGGDRDFRGIETLLDRLYWGCGGLCAG